jgi:hypothetical protein
MRMLRARPAILIGTVAPLVGLLAHCGGGDTSHGSGDAGDAGTQDAPANDATLSDGSTGDGANDVGAGDSMTDAAAAADVGAGDTGDASSGEASGGQDASDASDGGGATIDATPCQVGAGDAGDAGDGGPSCAGMLTCCSAPASPTGGFCTDTSKDPRNCGSCGTACSSTQFCTGLACDDAILKNICANPKATWIADPYGPDNTAGNDMGAALAGCLPTVTVFTVNEDAGVAQDPLSGRPLTGAGNTLVAGGGWFGHASVLYLDNQKLTPLILSHDGTNAWIRNQKTNVNIVFVTEASVTAHHDYFLLELSVEPVSGTLCFFGYGMLSAGTIAAGYYFRNNVAPALSTFTDAWYVYEWTDTSDAGMPNTGDTFTLLAHGT